VVFGIPQVSPNALASSNLPITYTSSNTSVANVIGVSLMITGAGTTDITASQAGNNNYNPAVAVMHTLTVSKANQNIAFSLPIKTMIDPDFNLDQLANTNSGLPLTYTSDNAAVATIVGNMVTITGVGSANITASQAGNANYNAASEVRQLVVMKASQIITFTLPAKTVIDPDFNLDLLANASSGLPLTYTSDNAAVATVSGNMVTIHGEGTANITASQAGDGDYDPTSLVQQLVVSRLSQTISFSVIPAQTVGNTLDLNTLASSTSSLTLSFTSSDHAVATIDANTNILTVHAAGTVTITATQSGDATYGPATPVTHTLTATAASGLSLNMTVLESKIYPNPTTDVLNIEPKQRLYGDLTLTISDMQGKAAYISKVQGGEESYKVDISALGSGVFMLELSNGSQMINQRIVKK
jgi:uncharacterized protein YjdB